MCSKFVKFQRPVDFEPKLTHVKRVLDEIEERILLIEIRSVEPEVIQNQLDQCMVSIPLYILFFFSLFLTCWDPVWHHVTVTIRSGYTFLISTLLVTLMWKVICMTLERLYINTCHCRKNIAKPKVQVSIPISHCQFTQNNTYCNVDVLLVLLNFNSSGKKLQCCLGQPY